MTEQPARPRSKRIYVYWGIALTLLLASALFCWLVAVPVMQARAIIEDFEAMSEADARKLLKNQPGRMAWYQDRMRFVDWRGVAAIQQAGGPQRALPLLRLYIRLPKWVAPKRMWAVFLMGYCGMEALPDVLRALESDDEEIREGGYNALGKFGPEIVPELLAALEAHEGDETWLEPRRYIIYALGIIGPPARDAVPALIKCLGSPEHNTRTRAAEALGEIGPDARPAVPVLRKLLLKDPEELVRHNAANALEGIGKAAKDAEPDLLAALSDNSYGTRVAAACALPAVGADPKKAVPEIIKLLRDQNSHVRYMAAYALADFGPAAREAVPELERLLNDGDIDVRKAAARALMTIKAGGKL